MEDSDFVQTCGAVGRFFHIDPVTVADSDYFLYAFRVAAFNYVAEKERQASEKKAGAAQAHSR